MPRSNCNNDTITVGIKNAATNPNLYFLLMPVYLLNGDLNASKNLMHQILITDFGYGSSYNNSRRNN
jgi:hypothetical protein